MEEVGKENMIKLRDLILEYGWIRPADRPREYPKLANAYKQHDLAAKSLSATGPMGLRPEKQDTALKYLEGGIQIGTEVFKFFRSKMDNERARKTENAIKDANKYLEQTYRYYDGESMSRGFIVSSDHCLQSLHEILDNISEHIFETKMVSA